MRLLLVEDNIRLGKLVCDALNASGYAVDLFSNAEEAEAALGVVSYDAIDFHPQDFSPTIVVDTDGDDNSDGNDTSAATDFEVGRIDPQIWPVTFDWSVEERLHFDVNLFA